MTTQLFKAIEEKVHGDDAVMKYLEMCREGFIAGDKTCLFETIEICARYQAVIPEWAADEILKIRRLIKDGEVNGFDEFFDFKPEHKATSKKEARLRKHTNAVLDLIQECRLGKTDNSLTADDILQTVADKLKISRRDVEDIYKSNKGLIKKLPKGNPENIIYGGARIVIPPYRRQGRAILKD